ncbi:1,4-dihydroxy-2-naphthoate polyprenyltransferase [Gorillibacterium timonense]|uniref:1,4-dihydroxy-2-naphthoate polyprenyltransferase n=1 Tax=Gorillibacterium timonense TaxID=1689269 RepID=UPI00071E1E44|nr:1,4-dihydroxy-2-naphthoate polyprenyltransferase [Gorillibacterium timonense]
MNIRSFLKLVEIQTKAASIIPFAIGTLYAYFRFERFDLLSFLLMLISLLSFDMATTAINNYMDYKKAIKTSGYGYESHNAIVSHQLREKTVVTTILLLLAIAAATGILLVLNSDLLVFFLGGLSFLVGILYSYGPVPISRMPLGELFSGLFMGFVLLFITVFIQTDAGQIAQLDLTAIRDGIVNLRLNLVEILAVFAISIPTIAGIANIMLANNICDMEDDLENRRYTLPQYIGKKNSLLLFRIIYYVSYVDVIALFLLGIPPYLLLIILATAIPLSRNIRRFEQQQVKAVTFSLSVKTFMLLSSARIVVLVLAIFIGRG